MQNRSKNMVLFHDREEEIPRKAHKPPSKKTSKSGNEPPNLARAIRLPVPDFNDPHRPPVCLELDFPIAPINALSNLEGNAGKPIYQMSKWWARRRSCIFRALLIAAATKADDQETAAKKVWEHYYCNHQKAGSFKKLRVLDPFMGGGTTLVEGSRLGFSVTGVDLNPVAWFVTKNELARSDPAQVKALFDHIEAEVKPLIQPFYTTTCPRGHQGGWLDKETGKLVDLDPATLPPQERKRYEWWGPEVIYTFWAKHGPCKAPGCQHRTPIFRSSVIAEKKLSTSFIPSLCPACGHRFNIELGETRMAPGVERVILPTEQSFTETSQEFARLINDYTNGKAPEKHERVQTLLDLVEKEPGLFCPVCRKWAGQKIKLVLERHRGREKGEVNGEAVYVFKAGNLKKKEFGIETRPVFMFLLLHPDWLEGVSGTHNGKELGGWAGAEPNDTIAWFEKRLAGLKLIEVRGRVKIADMEARPVGDEEEPEASEQEAAEEEIELDRKKYGLPREIVLKDGTRIETTKGTVCQKAHFTCAACGKSQEILEAVKPTGHIAPVAAYALQCHCPQCENAGYNYGGRYFKALDTQDIFCLNASEREWDRLREGALVQFWPHQEMQYSHMTHERNPLPDHGYTHWWKMFNSRQLLVHSQLLRAITLAPNDRWPLDVREQALGVFQQYLRNQNAFCIWDNDYDKLVPMMSNANFNPKSSFVENGIFHKRGRGNWESNSSTTSAALEWVHNPYELIVVQNEDGSKAKSEKTYPQDPVTLGGTIHCGSSSDLSILRPTLFDMIITDPPFGDNVYYADLSDFFYVWLRITLLKWYEGLPERTYFTLERTPHSLEAVDNAAEHPDDRENWEKEPYITKSLLTEVRLKSGNHDLKQKDRNVLYRPPPASEFYRKTLTACWSETGRILKPSGLLAFTFHHSEDLAWMNVLQALFDAGYVLVATYPIRSDETKGDASAFGSKKIEYDIIHVCRKRLENPEPVSWARMRRWVKDETARLKELLEHTHGRDMPESDIRVILRGKALEFYSRHYGRVLTGDGETLSVRDALLGINQLLDDLVAGSCDQNRLVLPDGAEPRSRLYLRLFRDRSSMPRDELHKSLGGTGVSPDDLESLDWVRIVGKTAHAVPVVERFKFFTLPGRTRKVVKTDLDQAHFLIGAASPGSGFNVQDELDRGTFKVKRSVDAILGWYAQTSPEPETKKAAGLALNLLSHWRSKPAKPKAEQMTLFDQLEAEES